MSDLLDLLKTIQHNLRLGENQRERRTFTPGATQSTVEALEDEIRALREELGMVREHLRVEKDAAKRALDTARGLRCELNSRLQALKRSEIEIASLTQALATSRAENKRAAEEHTRAMEAAVGEGVCAADREHNATRWIGILADTLPPSPLGKPQTFGAVLAQVERLRLVEEKRLR